MAGHISVSFPEVLQVPTRGTRPVILKRENLIYLFTHKLSCNRLSNSAEDLFCLSPEITNCSNLSFMRPRLSCGHNLSKLLRLRSMNSSYISRFLVSRGASGQAANQEPYCSQLAPPNRFSLRPCLSELSAIILFSQCRSLSQWSTQIRIGPLDECWLFAISSVQS